MKRSPFKVRLRADTVWRRLEELSRSQTWLAHEIGVSPSYVSLLVAGLRRPSGELRRRMQEVLDVEDFYDLFTLEIEDDNA